MRITTQEEKDSSYILPALSHLQASMLSSDRALPTRKSLSSGKEEGPMSHISFTLPRPAKMKCIEKRWWGGREEEGIHASDHSGNNCDSQWCFANPADFTMKDTSSRHTLCRFHQLLPHRSSSLLTPSMWVPYGSTFPSCQSPGTMPATSPHAVWFCSDQHLNNNVHSADWFSTFWFRLDKE